MALVAISCNKDQPTEDEGKALVEQCPSEWTNDYKGLKLRGRIFTATNGNPFTEDDYRCNGRTIRPVCEE